MNNPPEIGSRCIVWARPEASLILLFGEGSYEGTQFVNGNYWPVIKLDDGREIVVHQHGISVGIATQVADQCKRFKGDVCQWDLDRYLHGERPNADQRTYQSTSTNGVTNNMPAPKTASDRVLYIKKEIELQEAKIKVAEKVITDARAIIAAKKKEISDQTQSVISELSAVNPDFMKQLVANVAAQLQTGAPAVEAPRTMGEMQPVTQPVAPPVVVAAPVVARIVTPQPADKDVDQESIRAATED